MATVNSPNVLVLLTVAISQSLPQKNTLLITSTEKGIILFCCKRSLITNTDFLTYMLVGQVAFMMQGYWPIQLYIGSVSLVTSFQNGTEGLEIPMYHW